MNRPDKRWAEIAKSMQTINNKQVNRDLGEPQGHPTRSTAVLKPVKGLDRAVRGLRAPLDDGQRSSRVASASLGLGHVDLDGLGLGFLALRHRQSQLAVFIFGLDLDLVDGVG